MNNYIENALFLGSKNELLNMIISNTKNGEKKAYYAINSDCMLTYWNDQIYREIINQKRNVIYVDGMGVIYAQKLLKLPLSKERIATTDLFPALLEVLHSNKSELKIFLLGGEGDTGERVKKFFTEKYPEINIVGTHHGYFDKEQESSSIINLINSLEVDILFVGFGNPVQEKWVNQYYDLIKVNSLITCGGLFDYYSNNVKRAPLFMQKWGMEWLYRLLQEPRRLYKRYIFGNIKYIFKIINLKFDSITNLSKKGNNSNVK